MGDLGRRCATCGQAYAADVIFCPSDGTPLSLRALDSGPDPYLGRQLAKEFRIDALLGSGAMGRVYRAEQLGIDRLVALKLMHRDLAGNSTLVSRFRREARVLGSLRHPNVVEILSLGELEESEGRTPFMALEYLDGISLRSALAAQGTLSVGRALHVVLQVADAVGAAHQLGIVHRDLKPENLMLVLRGDDADFVKVLDFGVARVDDVSPSIATQAGSIFGSARYISPEAAAGEQPGPPGDVYALATILYECLTGATPFADPSAIQVLVKQQSATPEPLASHPRAHAVPAAISRVVDQNLAKSPAARAPDARAFGRALVAAARQAGIEGNELLHPATLLGHRAPEPAQTQSELLTTRQSGPPLPPMQTARAPQGDASREEPRARPRARRVGTQRALVVLLCFALGAGAALGIATRLGAFGAHASASPQGTSP